MDVTWNFLLPWCSGQIWARCLYPSSLNFPQPGQWFRAADPRSPRRCRCRMRCWLCQANVSRDRRYPTLLHPGFAPFFCPRIPLARHPWQLAGCPHPYPAPGLAGRTRAPLPRSETPPSCRRSAFSTSGPGRREASVKGDPAAAANAEPGMDAGMRPRCPGRAGKGRMARRGTRRFAAAPALPARGGSFLLPPGPGDAPVGGG